jgi:hypothetical protein
MPSKELRVAIAIGSTVDRMQQSHPSAPPAAAVALAFFLGYIDFDDKFHRGSFNTPHTHHKH